MIYWIGVAILVVIVGSIGLILVMCFLDLYNRKQLKK
jgi:uncharacterized membrane protein